MRLFYSIVLLFVFTHTSSSLFSTNSRTTASLQLPGQYYMVLYVESTNTDLIQAFIGELETLPNKIISVTHNSSTHEFTIIFTELIRNDTIYQILLKYFDDFKEIDGYYPN